MGLVNDGFMEIGAWGFVKVVAAAGCSGGE